jgi:hypothetical protein
VEAIYLGIRFLLKIQDLGWNLKKQELGAINWGKGGFQENVLHVNIMLPPFVVLGFIV